MAFEKVKLEEIGMDIENVKNRIDRYIQNPSPKQTLLAEATMHKSTYCAYNKECNILFLSITPDSYIYRDGYDCHALVDANQITLLECDISRYENRVDIECDDA